MAATRACRSSCQNPLPTGKDELAGITSRAAPTDDNGTPSHPPAISHVSTPALVPPLVPAKLVAKYTDTDLQRATKLALELFV